MSAVEPHAVVRTDAHKAQGNRRLVLGVTALGVVFGDIGTSPLYAFQDIFSGAHGIPPLEHRAFGAASLVFWTLTLIVSVKYVLIVMRADNDGEGGIIALAALAIRSGIRTARGRAILMGLGILGAALFYGDGMITPAISVLSAVQGLEVISPGFSTWVVPIAVVVLSLLFLAQRRGTTKVGLAFGPIMVVWFVVIGVFGLMSVVQTPKVLGAISPSHAIGFFEGEPMLAFLALGSVVLCVTGAEALYADMGHFGRGPIRVSWFAIVTPALYLTYFGQAALVIRDPAAARNPFYLMVPDGLRWPMVLLATIATVIASQAVISGAFSMTRQAMRLGYLPRLMVKHTSATQRGQVYLPAVNWVLMVAVIALVLVFRTPDNLAAAYGIAVTGTFVITTVAVTFVALHVWQISPWIVLPVSAAFLVIDTAFFASNLTKFDHGGWFPLVVAVVIFVLLTTWRRGRRMMFDQLARQGPSLAEFAEETRGEDVAKIPGTAVYLTVDPRVAPFALVRHVRMLHVMAECTVVVHVSTADSPRTDPAERVSASQPAPGIVQVEARNGFMERPDIPVALADAVALGADLDPSHAVYVIHTTTVEPSRDSPMWMPLQALFSVQQRLAADPSPALNLPIPQVVEVGTIVQL